MRASFRVRLHLCREIFAGLSTEMAYPENGPKEHAAYET
ncbi:MAG: hypothetical protein QOF03_1917 [Alphaproteobacteria bacterium]|nr:hypothetical protein [Alphaproteobacteria bacterium]